MMSLILLLVASILALLSPYLIVLCMTIKRNTLRNMHDFEIKYSAYCALTSNFVGAGMKRPTKAKK